ncbi:hypothetical protein HPB48_009101 [Haemaphysalis longicornis]|uniref:Uncharacterized protein n=1 Tax=Haemaphysalis longicornis TaxID=44386 RepID=A0A9J6GJ79_HAELO|nr:hypothetical protein HPB48_009101 [Haemaphysalis longicornis]
MRARPQPNPQRALCDPSFGRADKSQLELRVNGTDLKPIENFWGLVKFHLARTKIANATAGALWEAVKEEWERLQGRTDVVAALYEPMPGRTHDVIAVDGNYTGH